MKNFNNFIKLFPSREKLFLVLIFFGAFIVSIIETLSLGSLAGFVMAISDPTSVIQILPENKFKDYIITLSNEKLIFYSTILLIVLFIFKNLFILLFNYLTMWVERNILVKLSNKLLISYLNQPYIFHVNNNPNTLINSVISETARGLSFIFTSISLMREILVLLFLFLATILINYKLTIVIFLTMGVASIIFFFSIKNLLSSLGVKAKKYAEIRLKNLSEIFGIIKIIKLYNATNYFVKQFNTTNTEKIKIENQNRFIGLIPRSFLEIFAILTISIVIFFFLYYEYNFSTVIPVLTLLAVLLVRSIPAFGIINVSASVLQYHKQSMINILNEFEKYAKLPSLNNNEMSNQEVNTIEIKNLSFAYPNSQNYALDNINLKLKQNDVIGIIGGSGSGKSTLIDIILGLYSPLKGQIIINGKKNISLHQNFNDKIGYVPQDVYLIDDSIKNNIALGLKDESIDEKRIFEIIRLLKLEKLLEDSKDGINTIVGNRGVKLSGGQRQRIGLARAMYKKSQILILDEATNALDFETEQEIINFLIKNKENKIIMIINHRVNMLKSCDQIYMLNNGIISLKERSEL